MHIRTPILLRAARCGLAVAMLIAIGWGATPAAADSRQVVIPFDFESKFDQGRYGEMVGDMIWKKLDREKGFIIPESMLDVRDFCKNQKITLSPATSMDKVAKIVREDFGAHIGIWGSVERAPNVDWDVYDLVIKCFDFTEKGKPKAIYEVRTRTKTVSEIPHLYVKEMLDKLYGREPGAPPPPNQFAEKNWKDNPNLVVGDFESGVRGVPKGWEAVGGQQREPLGNLVKWIPEVGNSTNHVIRFTFSKGVGDSTGVMYYSDYFPVEEGARYRFQCRWRSNGPTGKVFIKCGEPIGSTYEEESKAYKPTRRKPGVKPYRPETSQMREVYRSQQNLKGPKNTWNLQTEDFTPKHTKYTPKYGRVMLYAYLGGGVIEFDDVVVKQILPASPGENVKDPRHSLETGVTIKEMEENERRSKELDAQRKKEQRGRP